MRRLPNPLEAWLQQSAASWSGFRPAPERISVYRCINRPEAIIFFCRLLWPDGKREVCLKQFLNTDRDALRKLFHRSEYFSSITGHDQVNCPRVLASDADLGVMAMTVVHGEPLENILIRSFVRGPKYFDLCAELLRTTATTIASFHKLQLPAHAPMEQPCTNRDYVKRLEEATLGNRFLKECLQHTSSSPESVTNALPASFWQRHEHRVLHGDFQAKNILVGRDNSLAVIDIDYGVGHPLRDIAQFLTQLERLNRRWRFRRARTLVQEFGNIFCRAYAGEGFDYFMEDLPFFRIWSLSFSLLNDERSSWPVRALVKHDMRVSSFRPTWQ